MRVAAIIAPAIAGVVILCIVGFICFGRTSWLCDYASMSHTRNYMS